MACALGSIVLFVRQFFDPEKGLLWVKMAQKVSKSLEFFLPNRLGMAPNVYKTHYKSIKVVFGSLDFFRQNLFLP